METRYLGEVLQNVWLGGRDSNPDTQIQSPLGPAENETDQQLGSANLGEVRQNPQQCRNELALDWEEDTLP